MHIARILLLIVLSVFLVVSIQIGCDELVTETIYVTEAGHPTADFDLDTFSEDLGCAPHTVTFVDLSDGPRDSWLWIFGDGDSSTDTTPTHTYDTAGLFTVTLQITDSQTGGVDTEVKKRFIYVGTTSADFAAEPDSGCLGLEVLFTPSEYGISKQWEWDFGDGSPISTDSNPAHTYDSADVFVVTLTVTDSCGSKADTSEITITRCPTVYFVADDSSGCAPFTVTFFDSSAPGTGEAIIQDSQDWIFGDGQTAYNTQNPTVTYSAAGIYTVTLTVESTGGTSTDSIVDFIIVYDSTTAVFSVVGDSCGCKSDFQQFQVKFKSESTGDIDSLEWTFGDGYTLIATDTNIVHAYINPGIYTVSLAAYGPCGSDTTTVENLVVLSDTLLDANTAFSVSPPSGDTTTEFTFTDLSSGVITGWVWDFGDGSDSATDSLVYHKFANAGSYAVSLTVSNDCGTAVVVDTVIVGE